MMELLKQAIKTICICAMVMLCVGLFSIEVEAAVGTLYWPVRNSAGNAVTGLSRGYTKGYHNGIDINNSSGCSWYAAYGGTVYKVFRGCNSNGYNTSGHTGCSPNYGRSYMTYKDNNGNVLYAGNYCNYGFGNGVIIQSNIGGETYYIQCAHMDSVSSSLTEGQTITAGTYLGTVGDRGFSFGTHAHFEIDKGRWYDASVDNDYNSSNCQFNYNYEFKKNEEDTIINAGDAFMAKILRYKGWVPLINNNSNAEIGKEKGNANELWYFVRQSDNAYTIKNMDDGKYLNVEDGLAGEGTNITVRDYTGGENQQFYIKKATDGGFALIPKGAKESRISIEGDSDNIGAKALLKKVDGSMAQRFAIYHFDDMPLFENIGNKFYAKILQSSTWTTLINNNSNVELGNETGSYNEYWLFERNNDGSYYIKNLLDGKYLEVQGLSSDNGTNIQVGEFTGKDNQKFYFKYDNEKLFVFIPKNALNTRLTIDNTGGRSNAIIYEVKNNPSQKFSIYHVNNIPDEKLEGPDNLDLEYGLSKSLNGLCTYGGKTDNIIYESLNKDIITIEDGWIRALKPGQGIIRATYNNDNTKYKDILCSVRALYFYEQYGQGLLTMDCKDARIVEYEVVATENDEGNVLTVTTSVNNDGEIINKTIDYVIEPAKQNKFFVLVDRKDFANANNDYTTSAELKDKNGKVIEKHSTTYNFDNFSDTYYAQLNVGDTIDVYDSVGYAEKETTKIVIKSDISEGKVTVDDSATKVTGNKGGRIYGAFINLSTAKRTMFIVDVLDDGTEKKDNGNQEAGGDNKNENNTPPSAGNTPSGDNKQDNTLPSDNNKPSKDNSTNAGTNTTTANKQNTVKRPKAQVAKISGVTVRTSTDGTAKVIKLPSGKKKITIPTVVKIDDVKYIVVSVGRKAFKGMKKNAVISINTKQPVNIEKNAFKGINSRKVVIKVNKKMKNSNFKRFKKILKKAGFKGKVKKVLK